MIRDSKYRKYGELLKIERRIHSPRNTAAGYRLKSDREIHKEIEDMETTIRKRRKKFYTHMVRMNSERLNKQIFNKLYNLKSQEQ